MMKKIIKKWTNLLNKYLDFGSCDEKPISKKARDSNLIASSNYVCITCSIVS